MLEDFGWGYNFATWSSSIKAHMKELWTHNFKIHNLGVLSILVISMLLILPITKYYKEQGWPSFESRSCECHEFKVNPHWPKVGFICINHLHCFALVFVNLLVCPNPHHEGLTYLFFTPQVLLLFMFFVILSLWGFTSNTLG